MNPRLVEAARQALLNAGPNNGVNGECPECGLPSETDAATVALQAALATLSDDEYLNNKGEVVRAEHRGDEQGMHAAECAYRRSTTLRNCDCEQTVTPLYHLSPITDPEGEE